MPTIYPNSPYYDDFDEANGFYRILFKPGYAVQARELTQLQTMLQNQIESFGKNIFKDGSIVVGAQSALKGGFYLAIDSIAGGDLADFEDTYIVGETSGARAKVVKVLDSTTDSLHCSPDSGTFVAGEDVTVEGTAITATLISTATTFSGPTSFFTLTEGIFFTKGNFVYCPTQTVIVSETLVAQPSARIGLQITEGIYTSDDDTSLLDPAVGSTNYFAPGADRYYIDLQLKSIEYDPTVEGDELTTVDEFIEIANVKRNTIVSVVNNSQYGLLEDTLARRTFDESGDYTVKPFSIKVMDHLYGNTSLLSVEVSPGKAYVRGYEFETIAPSYINLERAQDYNTVSNFPIAADYGRYLKVANVTGYFNTFSSQTIDIHKNAYSSVSFSTVNSYNNSLIGNAKARYFETTDGELYDLYLYDVQISSGNTFSMANSFIAVNGTPTTANVVAYANTYDTSNGAALTYSTDDSLLLQVPQERIKTFKLDGSVSDTSYQAKKQFTGVSFSAGTGPDAGNCIATITVTGNEVFVGSGSLGDDAILDRFFAVVTATSNVSTFPVGTVLDFTGSTGNVTIGGSSQTAELRTNGNASFTANIVATVSTSAAVTKLKTLTSSSLTIDSTANTHVISLNTPDIVGVTSIVDANGNNYTSLYTLDNGQRDDFYDHGKLTIKSGETAIALDANTNPNATISFQYFAHSGAEGFFDVDSYKNSGVTYAEIPKYTNSYGDVINLSDVMDFRGVRLASSNTIVSTKVVIPGSTVTADYAYYLPRIDKLVLTKERKLVMVKGVPSDSPDLPNDLPDGMTLYSFSLPAYTATPKEVKSTYYEHKRYTMRDIGKIDKRVDRLEYYSALSLLEKIAADERVPSAIAGIDRFKNGILVDSFAGHSVGDVRNGDYRCAIDFENRTLRPPFAAESYFFDVDEGVSTGYVKTGDLITANYTTTPFLTQSKATKTVNLTPYDVFDWVGRMTLDPATDVWADTLTEPTVTVNLNGENDAFTQITLDSAGLSPWGTRWNSWQTVFRGVTDVGVSTSSVTSVENKVTVDKAGNIKVTPTAKTETTTSTTVTTGEATARVGLSFSSAAKTITTNLGTKVIDSSILAYIRSRPVKFVGRSLKPNTIMYATFDNVDVTSYCRPTVEIKFTTNTVPTTKLTQVTHAGGWTGEVVHQRNDRVYVIPDTTRTLIGSGNTLSFANTVVSAVISEVNVPEVIKTNQFGEVAGVFIIPNTSELRFNLGERSFKLVDNLNKTMVSTSAETKYLAYGLSQTKQDTILATRMNLVSINPMLETNQRSLGSQTSSVTNQGVWTEGISNTVALPPTTQINNYTTNITSTTNLTVAGGATQTLFCGQGPSSTGQQGIHTFRVNLGEGVGPGNVIVNSGGVPDRFTLEYGGHSSSTGFMSSSGSGSQASNNQKLKSLGFPEVTRTSASNVKLPFMKMSANVEYATLLVEAPIQGTGWNFSVECPAGSVTADPGTAHLSADISSANFVSNFNRYWGSTLRYSSAVTYVAKFTVRNTANNPRWTFTGNDKSITITDINIDTPAGSTVPVTYSVSGATQRVPSGTYEYNNDNPSWTNNLGSFPITLQPGESRTFSVIFTKTSGQVINGDVNVSLDIEGPNGNPVPCNNVRIGCTTTVLGDNWVEDPIAQTFFVLPQEYPNGVFISSLDAYFYEKDSNVPVTCEIRPVVNGFPSSGEIMPFAVSVVDANSVVTSTTPDVDAYTRFTFPSPVYLAPGQYCFVLRGNSKSYRAFSAVLGDYSLADSTERIIKQPYVGSLFKSQNASTWTPEQNEDLMFRINRCSFTPATSASVNLTTESPSNNVEFDVFYTTGEILDFNSGVTFKYKTTDESSGTTDSEYTNYALGTNVAMPGRKVVKQYFGDTLQLAFDMSTNDPAVSPAIDLNRLSSVLVRNIINNDSTGEDSFSGGNALARYLTRRVTLNPEFEAQDLKVYLNAFCPGSSSIKVYYKVNAPGTTQFDSQNEFQEFATYSKVGNERAGFAEYTIETAGTCLPDAARFSTFVIKIVMLSPDTTQVPIIKDLRVLALDE